MDDNRPRGLPFFAIISAIAVLLIIVAGYYFFFMTNKTKLNSTNTKVEPTAVPLQKIGNGPINLVYATHWTEDVQRNGIYENGKLKYKGLAQYLEEYTRLHPDISFTIQVIPYNEYPDRLQVLSDADMAPDIYQIYSTWGVGFVQKGVLDAPPQDVIADVSKNYTTTAAVTINGKIWGYPTEINDYALLYNKEIFKAAGLVDAQGNPAYPRTWSDLVNKAAKLVKKDSSGKITQYGIAFLKGNDWESVDPFLSLLYSDNGQYLSSDYKKSLFNSKAGVESLDAMLAVFRNGATDINGNFFDFSKGTVAMVIAPPWSKAGMKAGFGDKFASNVGVAPFPVIKNPASLRYGWFIGTMAKSKHKKETWDFLKWFNSSVNTDGSTRLNTLLVENIGAIPARTSDFNIHKEILGDFFTKVYVDQMKYGVSEPNVAESSNIKKILMTEIEAAWAGQKTAKEALDSAAQKIDKILQQYY